MQREQLTDEERRGASPSSRATARPSTRRPGPSPGDGRQAPARSAVADDEAEL